MNRDPYEVLGISRSATDDEIKQAYRNLAKKYHPDKYTNSPLKDVASEKMAEVNAAYDQIQDMKKNGNSDYNPFGNFASAYSNNYSYGSGSFSDIRRLISIGRILEAEDILDGTPISNRDAEWYYLKGRCLYHRGFLEQAKQYFAKAHQMDETNSEYNEWLNGMANRSAQGMHFKPYFNSSLGSLCATMACLNCLCGGSGCGVPLICCL